MQWTLLNAEQIVSLHDDILHPGELAGMAGDKSLESAIARVDHRVHYGLIVDGYHLAASYAMVIATRHCFNDGNKRTALHAMIVCLKLNDLPVDCNHVELADRIIALAQGAIDENALAEYLRKHAA